VIVETVGVGQVEVEIASAADTTVVVVNPGWGDGVQAAKAGLLEIADVLVVNKADRAGVNETVRDLMQMLELGAERPWTPPVIETVATEGTGIDELFDAIERHRGFLAADGRLAARRLSRLRNELRSIVHASLTDQVDDLCVGSEFEDLVVRVADRSIDPYAAAAELVTR
jgi:LAO/AO transport system kinase